MLNTSAVWWDWSIWSIIWLIQSYRHPSDFQECFKPSPFIAADSWQKECKHLWYSHPSPDCISQDCLKVHTSRKDIEYHYKLYREKISIWLTRCREVLTFVSKRFPGVLRNHSSTDGCCKVDCGRPIPPLAPRARYGVDNAEYKLASWSKMPRCTSMSQTPFHCGRIHTQDRRQQFLPFPYQFQCSVPTDRRVSV